MHNSRNFSRRMVIKSMRSSIAAIAIACATVSSHAEPTTPEASSTQVIRVWGYNGLSDQLLRWESEYHELHPEVRFDNQLHGAAAVMAGLYDGVADVALMGREIWPVETMAYQWVYQQQPSGVIVATAGLHGSRSTLHAGRPRQCEEPARIHFAEPIGCNLRQRTSCRTCQYPHLGRSWSHGRMGATSRFTPTDSAPKMPSASSSATMCCAPTSNRTPQAICSATTTLAESPRHSALHRQSLPIPMPSATPACRPVQQPRRSPSRRLLQSNRQTPHSRIISTHSRAPCGSTSAERQTSRSTQWSIALCASCLRRRLKRWCIPPINFSP